MHVAMHSVLPNIFHLRPRHWHLCRPPALPCGYRSKPAPPGVLQSQVTGPSTPSCIRNPVDIQLHRRLTHSSGMPTKHIAMGLLHHTTWLTWRVMVSRTAVAARPFHLHQLTVRRPPLLKHRSPPSSASPEPGAYYHSFVSLINHTFSIPINVLHPDTARPMRYQSTIVQSNAQVAQDTFVRFPATTGR